MKQEKVEDGVLEEAKSKINFLLEGKVPEPMDVPSNVSDIEKRLAESVNILIKSLLVINDFIIPISKIERDKSVPSKETLQSLAFEKFQACQMQFGLEAKETVNGNYSQCIDFKGGNWRRLNTMVEQLGEMEGVLNEDIDALAESKKALLRESVMPVSATQAITIKAGNNFAFPKGEWSDYLRVIDTSAEDDDCPDGT